MDTLEAARRIEELLAQNAELASLNRLAEIAGSETDLAAFFHRAAGEAMRTAGCDGLAIYLVTEASDYAELAYDVGGTHDAAQRLGRIPLSFEPVKEVLAGQARVFQLLDLPLPIREAIRAMGFETLAMVPLRARSASVGLMVATFRARREAAACPTELLQAICAHFASAVEAQRLLGDMRRRVSELTLLNDIAVASATLDPMVLLENAVRRIVTTFDADTGIAYVLRGERLVLSAHLGISDGTALAVASIALEEGPAGEAVRTLQPATIERMADGSERARWLRAREGIETCTGIPLIVKNRPLGALVVGRRFERPFDDGEKALLSAIGVQLAVALENARLYDDLRRSYADLAQAQRQLIDRERLAALGELSAVVAHEVRNPLGVIFNSLGSLRRILRPAADAKMLLDIVGEEADRLNRIVGNLLDFARPATPALQPERLERVIEEALAAALSGGASGVSVERNIDPSLPPIPMDARMVRQALLNLALNAVQAMQKGGTLSVRGRCAEGAVELELADTGAGIPEEFRHRIFEPFFTTRAAGTGLGLAVVKRIIEAHRGEISVESRPGAGTIFRIRLPLGPSKALDRR